MFRVPSLAILGAVLLAVCATPVAFGAPFFWLIYLVPVAVVVWVLRVRTVADAEALTIGASSEPGAYRGRRSAHCACATRVGCGRC